jgi:ketosteroid isomerase-like protein
MSPIRMERLESGIRTVLAFSEAFNRHDLAAMLNLVCEDCVLETSSPAPDGGVYKGKASITQYWQDFFAQKADAHLKIEETNGLGFRCVALWRLDWIDASGQPLHLRGIDIFIVQNNQISQHLSYSKV